MVNIIGTVKTAIKLWYLHLLVGVLFIAFWMYIFTIPMEAYVTLSVLFSISFVVSWVLEIFFSIQNRDEIESWWWYLVNWVFWLAVWVMLLMYPDIAMTILPFVVWFVLLFRSLQLMLVAFNLKRFKMPWTDLVIMSSIWIITSILLIFNPMFTWISLVVVTWLGFIISWISLVILSFKLRKIKSFMENLKETIKWIFTEENNSEEYLYWEEQIK